MTTMRIAELARRSGVPTSTLRYYDSLGLVPARREPNGYRSYDDDAEDRLRFVGAVKSLGLDLSEVVELVRLREGSSCASVRAGLRPAVEARLDAARAAEAHARTTVADLERSLAHLARLPDRDDPCDPDCAFVASPARPAVVCSLPADGRQERHAEWRALAARASVSWSGDSVVLLLPADAAGAAADLAAREVACCAFLDVAITLDAASCRLVVTAPPEGFDALRQLLGEAS